MTIIRAETALLEQGWADNVAVEIDDDGRIASVTTNVAADMPANCYRVGILLPALVNVHSHAFQRAMAGLTEWRGPDPRDSFWTWRQLMYRFLDRLTPEHVEAIAAFVQMEMLEAGYATNVEFHYLHHQKDGTPYDNLAEMSQRIAGATAISGIGLTLLPVHYQYGGCDRRPLGPGQLRFGNDIDRFVRLHEGAAAAITTLPADARLGIAPHSLRAVCPQDLKLLENLAASGPVHMHLAEQLAEVNEVVAAWGQRPVEWFLDHCDTALNWCLIHCTQMQPHETAGLAQSGAVAGLCPITESSLGDGIFDATGWFAANGQIAIGSDSNIRISMSEELRTLEYSQRLRDHTRAALATAEKSTARRLYDAALTGGARAAGRNCGAIAKGHLADLAALDQHGLALVGKSGDKLLDSLVFAGSDELVSDVWSAGRHMVRQGRHIERDGIVARYLEIMRQLGDQI